jgi:uncharacterized protein YjbI with pentapeptide repeats
VALVLFLWLVSIATQHGWAATGREELTGTQLLGQLENGRSVFNGIRLTVAPGELKGKSLKGAFYKNAEIRGVFEETLASTADFRGAKIYAKFLKCKMVGADFGEATFDSASFDGSNIEKSRFDGSHFVNCSFRKLSNAVDADFSKCTFDQCDFSQANLRGASMSNAKFLNKCNLNLANIDGANLNLADLSGAQYDALASDTARYRKTKMPDGTVRSSNWLSGFEFWKAYKDGRRDFSGVAVPYLGTEMNLSSNTNGPGKMDHAILTNCNFRGSIFSPSNNSEPAWKDCDFSKSDFTDGWFNAYHSKVERCNFSGCKFVNSRFTSMKFEGCDFDNCNFSGAKFRHVTMTNCSFKGANWRPADTSGEFSTVPFEFEQ